MEIYQWWSMWPSLRSYPGSFPTISRRQANTLSVLSSFRDQAKVSQYKNVGLVKGKQFGGKRVEDYLVYWGDSGGATSMLVRCKKYGKISHQYEQCNDKEMTLLEEISKKVFALSIAKASKFNSLIQDTYLLNDYPLITLFDSKAAHFFILHT
ncbi:hypothetical protein CR513_53190, partial [Mucuna pruriens]